MSGDPVGINENGDTSGKISRFPDVFVIIQTISRGV